MKCRMCVCDTTLPNITFDPTGVCNYCHSQQTFEQQYPISSAKLQKMVDQLKTNNGEYDAVIGLSGGCDSSYLLYRLTKMGVRLLGVHWDNTWNTSTAISNIHQLTSRLNINTYTVRGNQQEYDDLCRAFLYASTPDADIPNDIALTTVLYEAAARFNIPYIINGHSFRTEGFAPLGWTYMDGQYIKDVHQKYGTVPLETYPNLTMDKWIPYIKQGIKRVRPLYFMDYQKDTVIKQVLPKLGWQWYNGHHMENKYTIFVGNYLWPRKFNIDYRKVEYSALIRSGQLKRTQALNALKKPPDFPDHILTEVLQRLHLHPDEFNTIMRLPVKSHHDYHTYQPYFKHHQNQFKQYYKQGLIPKTFYEKYVVGL